MRNAQFRGRRPVIQPLKPQNMKTSLVQAVLWGSLHLTLHSGVVKGGMGTSRIAFLISIQQLLSAPIYREEPETHRGHAGAKSALKNQPENMSHTNNEDRHGNLVGGRGVYNHSVIMNHLCSALQHASQT